MGKTPVKSLHSLVRIRIRVGDGAQHTVFAHHLRKHFHSLKFRRGIPAQNLSLGMREDVLQHRPGGDALLSHRLSAFGSSRKEGTFQMQPQDLSTAPGLSLSLQVCVDDLFQ